jgi:acetolactate synthase-1/2/3 large subunit
MAIERATVLAGDEMGSGEMPRVALRSIAPTSAELDRQPIGNVADALAQSLAALGVKQSFGIAGGAIAPFCEALQRCSIDIRLFRHEAGAAFAAMESYFVDGRPVVVFATTGPGFINGLVGIAAARWEGAKMILVSGTTPTNRRGQWAFQETSPYTLPWDGLYTSGRLFHFASEIHGDAELPEVTQRLRTGLVRPTGFVAHLALPIDSQTKPCFASLLNLRPSTVPGNCSDRVIEKCAERLLAAPFVIWVGFGARLAAAEVREFAERTGAAVMCSPRAKGIFPEDHPQYIGVTGFAGHSTVLEYMRRNRPEHVLVLGTRLGEFTSFWDPTLTPSVGFIHVDLDPEVPGAAYPGVKTTAIQADVSFVLQRLLDHVPPPSRRNMRVLPNHRPELPPPLEPTANRVRPQVLMQIVQREIVEKSEAVVITEAGNSFAWTTHLLRFTEPGRYRVSVGFGSMGHAVTGVVGAALALGGKAVAIAGDGAMLMFNEINTAVQTGAQAVWIVLNDSRYGMIEQGMDAQGLDPLNMSFPACDFVAIAKGMGADGIRVESELDLEAAVITAMKAPGPFVIDVIVDPEARAPFTERIRSLLQQGARPARSPNE